MPFRYVPPNRVVRLAWTWTVTLFGLMFLGLLWATISTALDLQNTNARLDHSEIQRQVLIHRMETHGFALTFMRGGHRRGTYVCKLTAGMSGYTCRAR
jgi:hypothetical protein